MHDIKTSLKTILGNLSLYILFLNYREVPGIPYFPVLAKKLECIQYNFFKL